MTHKEYIVIMDYNRGVQITTIAKQVGVELAEVRRILKVFKSQITIKDEGESDRNS